jgi:hypothetical protein
MAAEHQLLAWLAQGTGEIGDVIFELVDIGDVAAGLGGRAVAAQIRQSDFNPGLFSDSAGQSVIGGAMPAGSVNEDQQRSIAASAWPEKSIVSPETVSLGLWERISPNAMRK